VGRGADRIAHVVQAVEDRNHAVAGALEFLGGGDLEAQTVLAMNSFSFASLTAMIDSLLPSGGPWGYGLFRSRPRSGAHHGARRAPAPYAAFLVAVSRVPDAARAAAAHTPGS
jgi:hypothetical protein